MTIEYSPEMTPLVNNAAGGVPMVLPKGTLVGGKVRCQVATITLAAQATTVQIHIARVPKGAVLLPFEHNTDTSLGSSTVAFGTVHSGESAKFKAAATFTATDTPTRVGKTAVDGLDLSTITCYDIADKDSPFEDIVITIASASLPASGRYVVKTFYATE